jgi:molybdopterin molybdotransferase
MQGAQKLRSEAHFRVRRNDEVAAQRRRWTFYEVIPFQIAMISIKSALQRILAQIPTLGKERVPILHGQGRVLAEDIFSARNIPPWDNSAMDGYAVRSPDIARASSKEPLLLRVISDLPAGRVFAGRVAPGEAVRIMTGAPLPEGTDAVVPVEETARADGAVKILSSVSAGANIRRAGEDVRAGEKVLAEGTVLRPAQAGMLASLGRSSVYVYQRPRVAVLSTGDELLEIDETWQDGKIINSNSYSIAALVSECGGAAVQLGIARDRREDLSGKMKEGLTADILITTGGVSVGDYDLVKELLQEMGQMNFWKVAMRPGQPLAFGSLAGKPLFGLPGNPVSCMISFELFARPSLLKMAGFPKIFRPSLRATLREDVAKKSGLTYFVRCRLIEEGGTLCAVTTGEQGSGILSSMVRAEGLAVLPSAKTFVAKGETIRVIPLDPYLAYTSEPAHLSEEDPEG